MANELLVETLKHFAFLLELKSENPFKIKAFLNSARILEEQPEASELVESGAYTRIPGLGKGSQALVHEWAQRERLEEFETLKKEFPPTIFELLEVRGLGPKKSKSLYEELEIASLSELEYACQENRLLELKGFGAKTQENILKSIGEIKNRQGKALLPTALFEAEELADAFKKVADQVAISGQVRRRCEVISALDFVVSPPAAAEKLKSYQKSESGLPIHIHPAHEKNFGQVLLSTTGSENFVHALGKIPEGKNETSILSSLGWADTPAECREYAPQKKISLVEASQIRGVFHMHTKASDGAHSLEEMAEACLALGYEYMGVSEHSQSAVYANGLKADRVKEQRAEIDRLNKKFGSRFFIFHGIESDILSDGSLDYPDSLLREFDFVIASIHSGFKKGAEEMTARLCRALSHPATTWLGHPTGRLLLGREGYAFDWEKVLDTAAKYEKGIELNANPYRLDIPWQWIPQAVERGVEIGIFPDAHSVEGLKDVEYGLWMARKALCPTAAISNTKSVAEMKAWLAAKQK